MLSWEGIKPKAFNLNSKVKGGFEGPRQEKLQNQAILLVVSKKIGSKEFTLGSRSEVWKNEVALMSHHFPAKSQKS